MKNRTIAFQQPVKRTVKVQIQTVMAPQAQVHKYLLKLLRNHFSRNMWINSNNLSKNGKTYKVKQLQRIDFAILHSIKEDF